MDFGAISSDFERKILRPRKFFENFGPRSAANRTKSHAPQRADAHYSAWRPLKLVAGLCVANRKAFGRDLARFRTKNFAAAKHREHFRSKSRRNPSRQSMLTLYSTLADLCGPWQGCAPPIGREFGSNFNPFHPFGGGTGNGVKVLPAPPPNGK